MRVSQLRTESYTAPHRSFYQGPYEHFIFHRSKIARDLLATEPFNAGKWQALDISASDAHRTYELLNVTYVTDIPLHMDDAQWYIKPDLPWAEDHFQERVGGEPINPGKAEAYWPYHRGQGDLHKRAEKKYDHNYMERMWAQKLWDDDWWAEYSGAEMSQRFHGYRFEVGDLSSVVQQLKRDRHTRQAYLPIWFPEDTGAIAGQRVPCTLGWHFMIRDNELYLQYNMRSVEIYRHWTNDVYMAMRLAQWMCQQLDFVRPALLTMHMVSFHGFVGDTANIEKMVLPHG